MFRKKLYYFIHYGKHSLFSYKGYVLIYKDKKMHYNLSKVDLTTFYDFLYRDKRINYIFLGSVGDVDD